MTLESILTYRSMAEFYAALGEKLEQEVDFTIHRLEEIHANAPMKSPLFRANYYSIVLISAGRGLYFLDDCTYETKPQTIYFNNPGHIKGFEVFELVHGYVITFAETLRSIATAKGANVAQIAISWVLSRGTDIVPLIVARKRDRLAESVGALAVNLSAADLAQIEAAIPIDAVAGDRYASMLMAHLDSEK
jgi:Aldo/keto reductase family/AraC-like ligand binding domain